jgi:hypothetical protein
VRHPASRIDAKKVLRLRRLMARLRPWQQIDSFAAQEALDCTGMKRPVVSAMITSWQKAPKFPVWGQTAVTGIHHAGIWPG